jgi:tetratricopeptide (TPR) repeat protein
MRATVYTDRALARYAGRFVWLSIDTEAAANSDFLTTYPMAIWPTLLVIDPRTESVVLRYGGGATVSQLEKLLADGESAARGAPEVADAAIGRADRLASERKAAEAAQAYEAALAAAPPRWSRRGRASEGLVAALQAAGERERCARRALDLFPAVRGTYSAANLAATGLSCAGELPGEPPQRAVLLEPLERAVRETLQDQAIPLSADDRSGLFLALFGARQAQKDERGARDLLQRWAAFMEAEAAKARTPEERAALDSHRVGIYLELKEPLRAVAMLEQSERDLPDDYNPPARLAVVYKALQQYDKALAASDRAVARAYGPRKVGILGTRADIQAASGDQAGARRTLEQAIAVAESMPQGQRSEATIAGLKKKLAAN